MSFAVREHFTSFHVYSERETFKVLYPNTSGNFMTICSNKFFRLRCKTRTSMNVSAPMNFHRNNLPSQLPMEDQANCRWRLGYCERMDD